MNPSNFPQDRSAEPSASLLLPADPASLPSPANSTGSEARVPVPLAKEFKRAGMLYREFSRSGDIAIYCAKGRGPRIEYEVFEVQLLPAQEVNGRSYPAREAPPSSSDWGYLGFTYTNNSHRDPLAAALAKAEELKRRAGKEEAE